MHDVYTSGNSGELLCSVYHIMCIHIYMPQCVNQIKRLKVWQVKQRTLYSNLEVLMHTCTVGSSKYLFLAVHSSTCTTTTHMQWQQKQWS